MSRKSSKHASNPTPPTRSSSDFDLPFLVPVIPLGLANEFNFDGVLWDPGSGAFPDAFPFPPTARIASGFERPDSGIETLRDRGGLPETIEDPGVSCGPGRRELDERESAEDAAYGRSESLSGLRGGGKEGDAFASWRFERDGEGEGDGDRDVVKGANMGEGVSGGRHSSFGVESALRFCAAPLRVREGTTPVVPPPKAFW